MKTLDKLEKLTCWMQQIDTDYRCLVHLKTAKTDWHKTFGNAGRYENDIVCMERMILRKKKIFNLLAKQIKIEL